MEGGHYVVERQGRPPVTVEYLLIGIIGGVQSRTNSPEHLKAMTTAVYARFLFSWPEEPEFKPLTNDVAEIEPDFQNALSRLIDLRDWRDERRSCAKVPSLVSRRAGGL